MNPTAAHSAPSSWYLRHRRLTQVLLVVGVTLSLDLGASVLLRALGRHPADTPDKVYRMSHAVYHHGLKPSVSFDRAEWGPLIYPMRTNSLGFRDAQVRDVPLASDLRRILLIGDSFTEGLGVRFEETFAGRLAQALEPEGIELLNAGVLSYAPSIYLAKTRYLLEEVGLEFDHLLVMLDLSDIQDEVDRYVEDPRASAEQPPAAKRSGPRWPGRVMRFIDEDTVLFGGLHSLLGGRRGRASDASRVMLKGALNRPRCLWTVEARYFEEYGRAGLEKATRRMDELAGLLGAHGIQLTVAVYPWPDQIQRRDLESRQVSHWRSWTTQHGAGFIDCFPAFIDDRPAKEVIEACFLSGDMHFNSAGHAVLAECLLNALGDS